DHGWEPGAGLFVRARERGNTVAQPPADLRATLLRLAAEAVPPQAGQKPESLVVIVERPGFSVRFTPLPGELDFDAPSHLSSKARQLLEVLTPIPQSTKVLARKLGQAKVNTHTYDALRELQRHSPPLVVRTPDGYRLPE